MNVLITGGAGFIGSHLAEALIKRGDIVNVVEDLSTGVLENIAHLQNNPRFTFTEDSILNEKLMESVIDNCDIVYHLAAAVGVNYIMENRLRALEVNLRGTEIVLSLANKHKKKVMIASSSEIYGKNKNLPFREDNDRVLGATTLYRWSYSCSKAMNEFLALAYWNEKGLPVVIMRFFNTIGPRQLGRYGMVVPRFVRCALSCAPLTVYGDGSQTRSFSYIEDIIRAITSLAECPEAVGQAFNIGSDVEITIENLAKKIIRLSNSSSIIKYVSYNDIFHEEFEDMMRRAPDIDKIYRYTGWKPELKIDEALMRIIEYYKQSPSQLIADKKH